MALKDGDLIEFDYELWVEGQDRLYDTTLREAAEREGILDPEAFYSPVIYVVGSGRIIPGLEKAVRETPVGETKTVEIKPDEGYGPRDPKKIETIPMAEFRKNDVDPQVGLMVRHRNRAGIVTTVGGGRVRVDFNPQLAGKTLKYRFTVKKIAQSLPDKVRGLIRMNFPVNLEWKVTESKTKEGHAVEVEVPEGVGSHPSWAQAKLRALMDIGRFTELDQVRFVEAYNLPKRQAAPAPPA